MNFKFIVRIFAFPISYCFSTVLFKTGCSVSIKEHLSHPQPLLLLQNGALRAIEAFLLPVDKKGTLVFQRDEKIDLACPGGAVIVHGFNTENISVEAKCSRGITFKVLGKNIAFNSIKCNSPPQHTARYTGNKCGTNYREIEIGFIVKDRFIKHITTCFDDILQQVVYSQADLTKAIAGYQSGYPRPTFKEGQFFNVKPHSVTNLYKRNVQRKTINKILGLKAYDFSVIHTTNNFFLAKGHYTAKTDFVYGSQQSLTFYYINVAPQWQTFNDANWLIVENSCRHFVSERRIDLVVYTGSYGTTTLPDVNGKEQELYLWTTADGRKGIPVPAFYYRVLYEPIAKAGIAIIGVNNPYKKNITMDIICTDVYDKVDWLPWKHRKNITRGYLYCCAVDDFRNIVSVLPQFQVKTLLV